MALIKELEQLKEFITSPKSENAKDHLVFPLFQKLFGKKLKKQSDAEAADLYIEGKLVVELKTKTDDFLAGFYQALHYAKKGLSYSSICVITYQFVAVWKINKIPDFAKELSAKADPQKPANDIGKQLASKTPKSHKIDIIKSVHFLIDSRDLEGMFGANIDAKLSGFVSVLKNLESERLQINGSNFINIIEQLKEYFDNPLDAIHCFYSIVGFWDVTSTVAWKEDADYVNVVGYRGSKYSENIYIKQKYFDTFKKFVENKYIFTNEGSGLTVDYYFSRFDEVISKLDPEYAKQHGIFFTDHNLSKFALWFVREFYEKELSDKYIVLDPGGGSGNLVMSWLGHLKHKIVCELQPDLLKMIDRRMKLDPEHVQAGFTVVPKVKENKGLNFLDKSAEDYIQIIANELHEKNLSIDKPFAFLLNPPYKNTDEKITVRENVNAQYEIHYSILDLTGPDAGNERYLAFLAQIVNISRLQMCDLSPVSGGIEFEQSLHKLDKTKVKDRPLLLIFTPSSWLIPRPTYRVFRSIFDRYFKYEKGFIITGNEFFKIPGKFPISFTIWKYHYNENGNNNKIIVKDLTNIKNKSLDINWNLPNEFIKSQLRPILKNANNVLFDNSRGEIRDNIPKIINVSNNKLVGQSRLNLYRNKQKAEYGKDIISGFPLKDSRHYELKDPHGFVDGQFVGLMDDNTPVRIHQDNYNRLSHLPDRIWFRLDIAIADVNKSKCQNAPPNVKGYCAYDLLTSQFFITWFAITKSINGRYPLWANQFDIWSPVFDKLNLKGKQKHEFINYFYSLCFAFVLAENRCVITKFERDNPVQGVPEVFVDNPLCPTNPESFWSTTLNTEIPKFKAGDKKLSNPAYNLTKIITDLYILWNNKYCRNDILYHVGLQNEPYFKYFDYADFLTPYSGLIQIKKYAEQNNLLDLNDLFKQISIQTKIVKDEIYKILIHDFQYFD